MSDTRPADQPAQHALSWRGPREALRVIGRPRHLHRTATTALIVGTVLFVINQLNVVVAGHATAFVWFKAGLTYLVPFVVSNIGILIATHRRSV
ncbi:MAG: nitrate/nitrite transporter NrtS [Solirubrobacteraceae bacterium]